MIVDTMGFWFSRCSAPPAVAVARRSVRIPAMWSYYPRCFGHGRLRADRREGEHHRGTRRGVRVATAGESQSQ